MAGNNTNAAMAYIKVVKETFHDRRDKYSEFLIIMNDFKNQRVDAYGTVQRVKNLFEGQTDLILGFNMFMPDELKIVVPTANEAQDVKKPVGLPDALRFVNKVKARFQGDGEHVYRCFLDILSRVRTDNFPVEPRAYEEAYEQVAFLFGDQRDLLEEFTRFLPKGHWTSPRLVDELGHLLSRLSTAADLQENGDN